MPSDQDSSLPLPDFSLVETKDLITELLNRHDAAAITLYADRTKTHDSTRFFCKGRNPEVLGLIELSKCDFLSRFIVTPPRQPPDYN